MTCKALFGFAFSLIVQRIVLNNRGFVRKKNDDNFQIRSNSFLLIKLLPDWIWTLTCHFDLNKINLLDEEESKKDEDFHCNCQRILSKEKEVKIRLIV